MHARCGFSLLETAVVMGVAGLVLGGLWVALGNVRERSRQEQAVTDTAYVVQGVKDFFRNSAAVATDAGATDGPRLTSYIIDRGLVPPEMLRSRSQIGGVYLADHMAVSPDWKSANGSLGSFSVRSDVGDSSYQFWVDIRGLSRQACQALAPKLTSGEEGLAYPIRTQVNTTVYDSRVSPENAHASCTAGTGNTITLTYRLRDNV